MLISEKKKFSLKQTVKNVTIHIGGHFIIAKGFVHQQDMRMVNYM